MVPSFGSPLRASSIRRLVSVFVWSGGPAGRAPSLLQPIDEDVEAGGEPLAAVVEPDVPAEGDQGGEPVGGQRTEELVQLASDRRVAHPLLVHGGTRAADRKADGVVDHEEERQAGLAVTESGSVQRRQEGLGKGPGVGPQWVAGLEES